jgi:hypothetical protein
MQSVCLSADGEVGGFRPHLFYRNDQLTRNSVLEIVTQIWRRYEIGGLVP